MMLRGSLTPPTPQLLLGLRLDVGASSINCTAVAGGCQACLDAGRAAAAGGGEDGASCVWCPQEGGCVPAFACLGPADTCPVNYLAIVSVWLVLSALLCICCLGCATRHCLAEWRRRLRPPGARQSVDNDDSSGLYYRDSDSSSLLSLGSGGAWWFRRRGRQQRQQQQQRQRHGDRDRSDSLYDSLLLLPPLDPTTNNTDTDTIDDTTPGRHAAGPRSPRQARRERERRRLRAALEAEAAAAEQDVRVAVFRNSLLAEAGEREWACAVCAFQNRPRVAACSLCGTGQEAGLRWQEEKQKHEERRRQGQGDNDDTDRDPERQLTVWQRAARRRRVWQRRLVVVGQDEAGPSSSSGGGGGGHQAARVVVWVRRSVAEALASSSGGESGTAHYAKQEGEETPVPAPAPAAADAGTGPRQRRRGRLGLLLLPFLPFAWGSAPRDEEEEQQQQQRQRNGGEEDARAHHHAHRRLRSSSSFASLFRGSGGDGGGNDSGSHAPSEHEHERGRGRASSSLSFASYAFLAASPSPSPWEHQHHNQQQQQHGEMKEGEQQEQAQRQEEDDDQDQEDGGGLGSFVSVLGEAEGAIEWHPASQPLPAQPSPIALGLGLGLGLGGGAGGTARAAAPHAAPSSTTTDHHHHHHHRPEPPSPPSPAPPSASAASQPHDLLALLAAGSASNNKLAAAAFRPRHFFFLEALRAGGVQRPWSDGHIRLLVRRRRLLPDSLEQLLALQAPHEVRRWMRVQFAGEPGVDAGGVEREWFVCVARALTDPALGLFVQEPPGSGLFGINPAALLQSCGPGSGSGSGPGSARRRRLLLRHYHFAGRVLGKALLEHQTLPLRLSLPLRKHLLGAPLGFPDLEAADPALHASLAWLLHPQRTEQEIEALHLDFTVTTECPLSQQRLVRELRPGGAEEALTAQNKHEYVSLVIQDRLLGSVRPQLWWLLRGVFEAVPQPLLQACAFDPCELGLLLSGLPTIDVADWRRHTDYLGEYARLGARHRVVRWFWEVVEHGLDEAQRAQLLQFTTGGGSVPAQGFKALQSNDGHFRRFNLQSVARQELAYPRAHACFNRLDLPLYESKEELAAALRLVCSLEGMATGFTID